MANILIIGDIHQKVGRLNDLLKAYESCVDYTVFTGDYFDDFDDNCQEVESMAVWLRDNLDKPNRVFLCGNHDFQYMLPAGTVYCSGYAGWKREIIESVLDESHWSKIGFFHSHKSFVYDTHVNYWFSHAGITRHWFEHPVIGINTAVIEQKIQRTQQAIKGLTHDWGCIWAADRFRGGTYDHGGLLWNDWNNVELFENTTQVMGHTPHTNIAYMYREDINASNINVDTHLQEVIVLNTDTNSFVTLS